MTMMGLKTDKLFLPWGRITEVPEGLGGTPDWADVQGKPSTLAGFGLAAEVDAAVQLAVFGAGQAWEDVTTQRLSGVTYTNTSAKTLIALVSTNLGGTSDSFVDGVGVGSEGSGLVQMYGQLIVVVPPGSTYKVVAYGNGYSRWMELK